MRRRNLACIIEMFGIAREVVTRQEEYFIVPTGIAPLEDTI